MVWFCANPYGSNLCLFITRVTCMQGLSIVWSVSVVIHTVNMARAVSVIEPVKEIPQRYVEAILPTGSKLLAYVSLKTLNTWQSDRHKTIVSFLQKQIKDY